MFLSTSGAQKNKFTLTCKTSLVSDLRHVFNVPGHCTTVFRPDFSTNSQVKANHRSAHCRFESIFHYAWSVAHVRLHSSKQQNPPIFMFVDETQHPNAQCTQK